MTISNNIIKDCEEQHGIYIQSHLNFIVTGNYIEVVEAQGIKFQHTSVQVDSDGSSTIVGNVLRDTKGHSILITNTGAASDPFLKNITIKGNSILGSLNDGIQIHHGENIIVTGNSIINSARQGLHIKNIDNSRFSNNIIESTGRNGIFIAQTISGTFESNTIANNTIIDAGNVFG